ncbi:conserved exported protein of unknown function [Tenacibaculum sp. 190524A02b]|uniref:hypothetical protein n=1 Tax=Tenacibaculum vairaonense TaxID=3137860 RepID=UPI0032B13FFF
MIRFFSKKTLVVALVAAMTLISVSFNSSQVSTGEVKEVAYVVNNEADVQEAAVWAFLARNARRVYRAAERAYVVTREVTPHYARAASEYIRTAFNIPVAHHSNNLEIIMDERISALD